MAAVSTLGGLGALALLIGLATRSPVWGLASLLVGLLAVWLHHIRQLARLVVWTHAPIGTPVPRALGVWGFVFGDLSRRARVAYSQRERLAIALERFREASQAMPDGVLYLAADESIAWFNQRAALHYGLDIERDLDVPVCNLVRQPDFVRYLQGGDYREPLLFRSARGGGLTLRLQILPFGEDQKMVLSRDITQIERLETMRRDFVANVSHELRTPLTVVSGFLETVEDALHDAPPEELLHYIRLASEQARRMQSLIEDLLTLSALETGSPPPPEEWLDLAPLIARIHHDTELLSAGRHRVTLALEGPTRLRGSGKELASAFSNLANNAVRYTPAGGTVHIAWHADARGGEYAVEDSGIGIAAEHLPRLTERFYRVDRGRSRETGGTGLGLAIVKHILTRHQAELHITSEPGRGSRFAARFPATRLHP